MVAFHIDALMVYGSQVSPATPAGSKVKDTPGEGAVYSLLSDKPPVVREGMVLAPCPAPWTELSWHLQPNKVGSPRRMRDARLTPTAS